MPLRGGLRAGYYTRERMCSRCGTIWRIDKKKFETYAAFNLIAVVAGIAVFFSCFPKAADWLFVAWVVLWFALFWPLMYYIFWRLKLRE